MKNPILLANIPPTELTDDELASVAGGAPTDPTAPDFEMPDESAGNQGRLREWLEGLR